MIVPVVFSTDDNYVPYLGVAIQSIKAHAYPENEYHLYVLYTSLTDTNINRLQKISEKNIEVKCVDISRVTEGLHFSVGTVYEHVTLATYYRIFIPHMFEEYTKIVYLDCDLVVCRDVADLFTEDLKGNPVGAVHPTKHWTTSEQGEFNDKSDESTYFNSGVLLIDVAEYKKNKIMEKSLELINTGEKFVVAEQTVLCRVLKGQITYLNNRWNLQWHRLLGDFAPLTEKAANAMLHAKVNPWIVHYMGDIKPWHKPEAELAEYFWKHARNTVFYEEIIYKNSQKNTGTSSSFPFPFDRVKRNSNIILYAAGKVGKDFFGQIEQTNHCKCVLWVDTNYTHYKKIGLPVDAVEKLLQTEFDFIVIAVMHSNAADEISDELVKMGVPKDKILWESPI